jgi:hypothetical protein
VLASHHLESEGRRNREIILVFSPREREKKKEGFRKKKAKSREGPDSDAKTMCAKESSRTGRVQSTTNDWTFLDPFFAAGAMFDYYYLFIYKYVRMRVFCFMKYEYGLSFFFGLFSACRNAKSQF